MLRRQTAARLLLVNVSTFRDANQRIMRLVELRFRKINIIRGNQRDFLGIGHFDKATLRQPLCLRQTAIAGVALQFHVKPVLIDLLQPVHQRLSLWPLPLPQKPPNGAIGAARETDQSRTELRQFIDRDLRQLPALIEVGAGVQLHQVLIPLFGLRQQYDGGGCLGPFARLSGHKADINLTADNGLDPGTRGVFREFKRREHVVCVGDRNRWHVCLRAKPGEFFNRYGPLKE